MVFVHFVPENSVFNTLFCVLLCVLLKDLIYVCSSIFVEITLTLLFTTPEEYCREKNYAVCLWSVMYDYSILDYCSHN